MTLTQVVEEYVIREALDGAALPERRDDPPHVYARGRRH